MGSGGLFGGCRAKDEAQEGVGVGCLSLPSLVCNHVKRYFKYIHKHVSFTLYCSRELSYREVKHAMCYVVAYANYAFSAGAVSTEECM